MYCGYAERCHCSWEINAGVFKIKQSKSNLLSNGSTTLGIIYMKVIKQMWQMLTVGESTQSAVHSFNSLFWKALKPQKI